MKMKVLKYKSPQQFSRQIIRRPFIVTPIARNPRTSRQVTFSLCLITVLRKVGKRRPDMDGTAIDTSLNTNGSRRFSPHSTSARHAH
jgi:hypothetical protein